MDGFQYNRASDNDAFWLRMLSTSPWTGFLVARLPGTQLGASKGETLCTDYDFADDVALMSEVYDVLLLALSTFEEEALELGLHTNLQKTKVQSLSDFLPRSPKLTVRDEVAEVVERFQYTSAC